MALEQVGLAITITCKAVYQMWSGSLTVPGKLKCTAASLAPSALPSGVEVFVLGG